MEAGKATGAQVTADQIAIRHCHEQTEFQECVALQREVWNFADVDLIPTRMFSVADKIGGQVIGAYDGKELVGFALAIPGNRNGHLYLHSHMLAVREAYRNLGLGKTLKLAQYKDAVERGFELMEWTFDPLEIKNAYLNITKLGAIARRYNINQYGMSSSKLQGGLPTDRLVAEWWLKSERVKNVLERNVKPNFKTELSLTVPAEIYEWKASGSERASKVQLENRESFLKAFASGLTVLGFERDEKGNGKFLLGKWDEKLSYAS